MSSLQSYVEPRPQAPQPVFTAAAVRHAPDGREPRVYRGPDYYGMPVVKHSHYKWRTAAAFFSEGVAAGAQLVATAIDWAGRREDRALVAAGRYIAPVGAFAAASLLLSSLHNPRYWYNILRIFRPTAPISIGTWSLTAFGLISGAAAAGRFLQDGRGGPDGSRPDAGRLLGTAALLPGIATAAYVGTEMEETSMPLWAAGYPLLPVLVSASAMSEGIAALEMASSLLPLPASARVRLDRLALLGGAAQLAAAQALDRRWQLSAAAESFRKSIWSALWRFGVGGGLTSAWMIRLTGRRRGMLPMARRTAAAAATLLCGLAMRFILVYAGRESGKSPRDYLAYTGSSGIRAAEPAGGRSILGGNPAVKPAGRRAGSRPAARIGARTSSMLGAAGLLAAGIGLAVLLAPRNAGGNHDRSNP